MERYLVFVCHPLAIQLNTPITCEIENLTVDNIINNGRWGFSTIGYHLPQCIAHTIQTTLIPNNECLRDNLKCSLVYGGKFSTKLACQHILNSVACLTDSSDSFSWIWIQCPNKIKFFVWLCYQNRLLSTSYLNHVGLSVDPFCKHCNMTETVSHIFRL